MLPKIEFCHMEYELPQEINVYNVNNANNGYSFRLVLKSHYPPKFMDNGISVQFVYNVNKK